MKIQSNALVDGDIQFQDPDFFKSNQHDITIVGSNYFKFPKESLEFADAGLGFMTQPGRANIHCMGSTSAKMPSGPVANRLERVQDPDNPLKVCWLMQAHKDDPQTASTGAKRAEFCFSTSSIKEDRLLTLGFNVRIGNYHASTDRFLVLQIHGPTGTNTPPFAMYVRGNELTISIHGPDAIPRVLYTEVYSPNTWMQFVFRFAMSPTKGVFEVWKNGQKIISDFGSFGYDQIANSYLKSGIYQWTSVSNVWDNNFPMKTIHAKGPYMVEGSSVQKMIDYLASL